MNAHVLFDEQELLFDELGSLVRFGSSSVALSKQLFYIYIFIYIQDTYIYISYYIILYSNICYIYFHMLRATQPNQFLVVVVYLYTMCDSTFAFVRFKRDAYARQLDEIVRRNSRTRR